MTRALVLAAIAIAWLASPPVDAWLGAAMVRVMLLELPAWTLTGWLIGRALRGRIAWRPSLGTALGALVFALGSFAFWLLPRSLDAAASLPPFDPLRQLDLLLAGAALSLSLPRVPLIVRVALGIYACSMVFAMGTFYASFDGLVCGAFDRAQQAVAGGWLLTLCPLLVLVLLWRSIRAFSRLGPLAGPPSAPHPGLTA